MLNFKLKILKFLWVCFSFVIFTLHVELQVENFEVFVGVLFFCNFHTTVTK
jgi:hypothetical protein